MCVTDQHAPVQGDGGIVPQPEHGHPSYVTRWLTAPTLCNRAHRHHRRTPSQFRGFLQNAEFVFTQLPSRLSACPSGVEQVSGCPVRFLAPLRVPRTGPRRGVHRLRERVVVVVQPAWPMPGFRQRVVPPTPFDPASPPRVVLAHSGVQEAREAAIRHPAFAPAARPRRSVRTLVVLAAAVVVDEPPLSARSPSRRYSSLFEPRPASSCCGEATSPRSSSPPVFFDAPAWRGAFEEEVRVISVDRSAPPPAPPSRRSRPREFRVGVPTVLRRICSVFMNLPAGVGGEGGVVFSPGVSVP